MLKSFFHTKILLLALCFGVLLGVVDVYFDYYQGDDPFILYIFSDFPLHEFYGRGLFFIILSLVFGMIVSLIYNQRKETQSILDHIFDNIIPICITSKDYDVIMANRSYYRVFGVPEQTGKTLKCYEHRPGPQCRTETCPVQVVMGQGKDQYTCESIKEEPNKPKRTFIVSSTPYHDSKGKLLGIIECFQDITVRKELESEKEKLIGKLNHALAEVKKLSGFLPICSNCKKVRDDKGYWKQIEDYISEHSGTEFSHSICPECAAKYYAKLGE